jgi:hypothetical protein
MEINIKDIRAAHRKIGESLDWVDRLMIRRSGAFDKKSIEFLSGDDEYRDFMQTEYDSQSYKTVNPRALYQVLLAIDKGRIPARMEVFGGVRDTEWVDVGSMLTDRYLVKDLHKRMQQLDWQFESSKDPTYILTGNQRLEEIKKDLLKLCSDEYGLSVAGRLWDQYAPASLFERPFLFSNRSEQWHVDSLERTGTLFIVETLGREIVKYTVMEAKERDELRKRLQALGSLLDFSENSLFLTMETNVISERQKFGRLGKPDFLDISWKLDNGKLNGYEFELRKHIEIPEATVAGVDLKDLESRMARIDWGVDWFPGNRRAFVEYDPQRSLVNTIARDLNILDETKGEGKDAFEKLALKFFAHTVNNKLLDHGEILKAGYEKRLILEPDGFPVTALQAYNLLDGRSIKKKLDAQDKSDGEWFAVSPAKRNADGTRVIERIPNTASLMLVVELHHMGGKIPEYEDVEAIRNGSKVLFSLEIDGVKADRILYADPVGKRMVIDQEEGEYYGLYQVSDEQLYSSRIHEARSFLPALEAHLTVIGVDKPTVSSISREIIERNRSFVSEHEGVYDNDLVRYNIEIGKNIKGDFSIHQIHADLRKGPRFSDPIINSVDVPLLEKLMQSVDWKQDFTDPISVQFNTRHPGGNKEMQDIVSQVQTDIQYLYHGPNLEGSEIAAALALKYLKNTPNEGLVPSLVRAIHQKELIINFPGKPQFPLESLYHLMNDRFAMGYRPAEGEQVESRQWYKLDRVKTLMGIQPPITLVPGDFSVIESLKRYPSVVELKMPTLLEKLVKGLEVGRVMSIHLDREKFAIPIFIYADPPNRQLKVDLATTLMKSNLLEQAFRFRGERMDLGRLMTLVAEVPSAKQIVKKLLGGGKKGSSDDPEGNNFGRGRKR